MRRALLTTALAALVLPASASAEPRFAPSTLPMAGGAEHIAVGDFDGDGRDDLAVTGTTSVTIRLNIASPSDAGPSTKLGKTIAFPATPSDVAAADINSDGRDDLVVTLGPGQNPQVYMTSAASTLPSSPSMAGPTGSVEVEAADLDGDGDDDLAFITGSTLEIVRNDTPAGTTTWASTSGAGFGSLTGPEHLSLGTIRGTDTLPDVILDHTPLGVSQFEVYGNNSTAGGLVLASPVVTVPGGTILANTILQADADAKREVIFSADDGRLWLIQEDAGGSVTAPTQFGLISPAATSLASGPLDGQADLDELVAFQPAAGGALVYEDFGTATPHGLPTGMGPQDRGVLAKLTGDDALDVITTSSSFDRLGILSSIGRVVPTPFPVTFPGTTPVGTTSAPQTVTLTNDRWAPVLVLGAVALPGNQGADFSVDASDCLVVLLPLGLNSCELEVRFTPAAEGARNGSVRVITPGGVIQANIGLNGTGGPAPPPGTIGPQGPDGNPGANGANGTQGIAGQQGAQGAAGPNGQPGANGPPGDTGATGPAGRDGTPTCSAVGTSKRAVCKVMLSASPTTRVTAKLTRSGKTYATGSAQGARKGAKLKLTTVRTLKKGTYRLELTLRPAGRKATKVSYAVRVG